MRSFNERYQASQNVGRGSSKEEFLGSGHWVRRTSSASGCSACSAATQFFAERYPCSCCCATISPSRRTKTPEGIELSEMTDSAKMGLTDVGPRAHCAAIACNSLRFKRINVSRAVVGRSGEADALRSPTNAPRSRAHYRD